MIRRRPTAGSPREPAGGFWSWLISQQVASVPQAMAPITFTLATVSAWGRPSTGAGMVSAMTACQMLSAVPLSRLSARWNLIGFLRATMVARGAALVGTALGYSLGAGPVALICLAGAVGVASGPIFGSFRALLTTIVPAARLPRALALSVTANEFVFVAGPVAAALLGSTSALVPLLLMAACAVAPAGLLPSTRGRHGTPAEPGRRGAMLSSGLAICLLGTVASTAVIATAETGAVALSVRYGQPPRFAALFTVGLCLASITGGVVQTVANRLPGRRVVSLLLGITVAGAALIGSATSLWMAVAGCVLAGLCLAPLGTYFSLVLEGLLPVGRRAEGFSLLRAAQGVGVVSAASLLTRFPVGHVALIAGGVLALVALPVAIGSRPDQHAGR